MTKTQQRFLEAFRQSIYGLTVDWQVPDCDLSLLFEYARLQKVLPLIAESLHSCPWICRWDGYNEIYGKAIKQTAEQIVKEE